MKDGHSKLNKVNYTSLKTQPHLQSGMLNKKVRLLLYLLMSRCHTSKDNVRKMFKNNVKFLFGCNESKSQIHVFINCFPVISQKTASNIILNYDDTFRSIHHQKQGIQVFKKNYNKRQEMKDKLSPGGDAARTQRDS